MAFGGIHEPPHFYWVRMADSEPWQACRHEQTGIEAQYRTLRALCLSEDVDPNKAERE